jgi:diguanylate cyclase (GGDEF)-like protein
VSIALLDVDRFKTINDERGHAGGDLVLAGLGALLGDGSLRLSDLAARWGGEEFVVTYLSADREGALVAAERLRARIEAMEVRDERGARIPVTASIGVATLRPDDTLGSLVGRADQAMYEAKAAGRNRVAAG